MRTQWYPFVALVLLVVASLACVVPIPPTAVTLEPSDEGPVRADLEPEKAQVWHRSSTQEEREVSSISTAGTGDHVWTKENGQALLKWSDLWLRLYDDNANLQVMDATPGYTRLFLAMGTALCGYNTRPSGRIEIRAEEKAEITFVGTMVMISYHPEAELVFVRVFDGEATVDSLTDGQQEVTATAGEWVLVGPGNPPEVSDRLEDMRELARDVGAWDVFHAVELDVAAGFADDIAADVPSENVQVVFVEEALPPECEVVSPALNIRSGPGTNYRTVRGALSQGTVVEPIGRIQREDWLHVVIKDSGETGWISGLPQYVACNMPIGDLPVETPPPTPKPTNTPIPTSTPTHRPITVTPTHRPITVTPTRRPITVTPTYTPTPTPLPEEFGCSANPVRIQQGQSSTLSWNMTGVQAVYLDGQGVAGIDHRVVTPSSTQTYTLRVITQDGQEEFCPMTVEVPEPEIVKIKCDASPSTIQSGECSTLIWNITGVRDVYLEGRHGVAGVASQEVCLYQSQTFVLEIGLLDGSRTSCSMPVTVSTPVPPQPPIADFSANPREIYCGAEVHFTNLSTNANTYYWDFGDGHTSTEHNPIHEYVPSEGGVSYTVSLIAQGPTGTDGETKYDYVISSNCVR